MVDELVAQIENQHQDQAEVCYGHVGPVQAYHGWDVLSGDDDQTEDQGQYGSQGVKLGVILEFSQIVPLQLEGLAKAEVTQGYAHPGNEACQPGCCYQPHVEGLPEDAGGKGC